MNKIIPKIICALSLLSVIYANGQQLKFYKVLAHNDTVEINKIMKRSNDSYLLTAIKDLDPSLQYTPRPYLLNISKLGNPLWKKYVDANIYNYFNSYIQELHPNLNSDKNIFTGLYSLIDTMPADFSVGPFLMQADTAFNTIDFTYYLSLHDTLDFRVKQTLKTADKGYMILGDYSPKTAWGNWIENFTLTKTDSLFNPQWMRSYKNIDGSLVSTITTTQDGGYVVGGFTKKNNTPSLLNPANFYMKTDSMGNIL